MIDPNKCELEEYFEFPDMHETVFYFTYPVDFSEAVFAVPETYGNVVSMCVSLTVSGVNGYSLALSPTVEEGDSIEDVDWVDLEKGRNYTEETVYALLKKVSGPDKEVL